MVRIIKSTLCLIFIVSFFLASGCKCSLQKTECPQSTVNFDLISNGESLLFGTSPQLSIGSIELVSMSPDASRLVLEEDTVGKRIRTEVFSTGIYELRIESNLRGTLTFSISETSVKCCDNQSGITKVEFNSNELCNDTFCSVETLSIEL